MDSTAIAMIQQTAIDAHSTRLPTDLERRLTAIPDNYTLHDLEKYLKGRERFRGTYATQFVADFVAYVKARKGEGYIDADKHSAVVFFNLGTKEEPGHGDHRAVLTLKPTAAFNAMLKADGAKTTQRDMIDWLTDWAPNLCAISQDSKEIPSSQAITAIRQVTIEAKKSTENTQGDFNVARSTMEEVEARSKVGLPAGFTFECEPYLGLPKRAFFLRLSVNTNHEAPTLTLRIVRREAEEEAIAQDFKRVLLEEIGDDVALTIGTFTP